MTTRSKLGSLFKYVIRFVFQGIHDAPMEYVRLSSSETIDTVDLIKIMQKGRRR